LNFFAEHFQLIRKSLGHFVQRFHIEFSEPLEFLLLLILRLPQFFTVLLRKDKLLLYFLGEFRDLGANRLLELLLHFTEEGCLMVNKYVYFSLHGLAGFLDSFFGDLADNFKLPASSLGIR